MKKTDAQQVGDIIRDVFARAGQTDNASRYRALVNWVNVVGPGINRLTSRRYVAPDGVMHVFISSASVKSDLQFMRPQLLEQLNAYAGAPGTITDIIIH